VMTDVSRPSQTGRLLFPYLWFDADLNLIGDGAASLWPTAVITVLRACVRRALEENRTSFQPCGLGPLWQIARVDCAGSTRLAVFVDQSAEAELLCS
jgi:hypothetical protein